MLDKLENELRFVEDQLKGEAFTYQEWSRQKAALVSQAFGENDRATITSTSDPLLDKAIKDAVTSVIYTHEAELHELVAKLIPDLIEGVVLPLKDAVKNAHQSLVVERGKTNSAIALWPESDVVPVRLLPAPNEFLLEEPSAYPKILTDLVERTINPEDGGSARREAELQVLLGTDELQSDAQQLVGRTRRWVPKDHNLQADFGAVPQRAAFELAAKPEQVLGRAEEWLRKDGTAVGRYMSQGLRDYLSPDDAVSPAEHDSRLNQFRGKLISALNASAPLVKVNPAVLVNVHGVDRVAYTSHFGEIPLPANSPGRDAVRSVLESRDEWREEVNKSFTDGNGGFIDVFTHLNAAYEPVVFDSLMKPIASDWGQKSTTPDRRAEFWRWRRARPLTEFIPVSTSILKLMVKGWFVAARLDHLDLDEGAIWVPDTNTAAGFMAEFPEFMLRPEAVKSSEGVAVALESMMLALIEVNTKEQVKPFAAYERLRQLGEETSSGFGARPINPELEALIVDGTNTRRGLPAPAGTPAARQAKLLDEVVTLLDRYRKYFAHIAKTQKVPLDLPPTWDLRKLIDASLTELMHTVRVDRTRAGRWGMGLTSLTVFVVADDDQGIRLRETFVRWSRERLVAQSAWVTPSSTQIPDFGPPVVLAQIVEDGTSHEEDLFRFIGKYRLNVVRVVLGQLIVGDDAPVDAPLHKAAASIVDAIDRALPKSAREDGHSTQLWRINVVVPVSGVRAVHPGTLIRGWNVNAIVPAEDRPDADHANVFVRDPGNAVGHAAAALAAAGGVFSGVEPGMFDALGRNSVHLQRTRDPRGARRCACSRGRRRRDAARRTSSRVGQGRAERCRSVRRVGSPGRKPGSCRQRPPPPPHRT